MIKFYGIGRVWPFIVFSLLLTLIFNNKAAATFKDFYSIATMFTHGKSFAIRKAVDVVN